MAESDCLCWVGHGDCGGCSGYPGITHEPACGWEQNPDCPVHQFNWPDQVRDDLMPSGERPYHDVPSDDLPGMWDRSDFIDDRDDYYSNVPEGYHVVEDLDGERLVANAPKRTVRKVDGLWKVTNHPDGVVSWATHYDALLYATGRLERPGKGWRWPTADTAAVDTTITNLALYGSSEMTLTKLRDGRNDITVHDHQVGP